MTYLSVTAYYFVKKSLLISFIHDLGTLHTDLSGSRIMTDLIHDFSAIYSVFKRLYLFILMVLARILMVFVAPPSWLKQLANKIGRKKTSNFGRLLAFFLLTSANS